jgi:hypothetical protein
MARPRKPTAVKVLQGTLQKCRTNENEPVPDSNPPVVPATLADIGQAHFDLLVSRLDNENRASASYTEIIALAAMVYQEMRAGDFCTKLATLYRGCLNDLGLTPSSASKVSAQKKEPVKINKFAK